MTADLQLQVYKTESLRYMAQELGNEKWRLAFGDGTRRRQLRRSHAANTKAPLTSVRSRAQEKSWAVIEKEYGQRCHRFIHGVASF